MLSFSIVDLETTGLHPKTDRIIELAVVRLNHRGETIGEMETLLNPERDVAGSDKHGLTASDVMLAPRFEQIAGDVFELLADSIIVGHNIRFDQSFLAAEARRLGWSLPFAPFLDTIQLSGEAGFDDDGRSLAACCRRADVVIEQEHRAICDARATARLFLKCLACAPVRVANGIADLQGAPLELWPRVKTTAERVCRTIARELAAKQPTYLRTLVARLPGELVHDDTVALTAYYALLDAALEDRTISDHEADALIELATEWNLSQRCVRRAHQTYMDALIAAAVRDAVISEAERSDLDAVARLLGVDPRTIDRRLDVARTAIQRLEAASPDRLSPVPLELDRAALAGKKVCFSGDSQFRESGVPLTRERAQELAEEAGLDVVAGVTKTLNLLVVADPNAISTKVTKAREYGVRIVSEDVFWRALGVTLD